MIAEHFALLILNTHFFFWVATFLMKHKGPAEADALEANVAKTTKKHTDGLYVLMSKRQSYKRSTCDNQLHFI